METLRDTALEYLKQQDFAAAIDYLNRQPDPLAACSAYADLVRHLYWQQKDLPGVVMMAQAGIQYGTAAAEEIGPEDSDPWKELLSIVKGLAYDLGSFTWPGWDEPGITITPADLNTGREAAKTNLRLAQALKKGDRPLSLACWLIGAHHLAAAEWMEAYQSFMFAMAHAWAAGAATEEALCHGYRCLTKVLASPDDPGLRTVLAEAQKQLANLEHGQEMVAQLETAARVFARGGA